MSEPVAWQQGHRRSPWGQPKGRLSAQAAILKERARSQSTSSTRRLPSPPPARYTHAPLHGASNAPRHAHSRALSRPHATRPACASPGNHTLLGQEPAPSTRTHPRPGGALSVTFSAQKYCHERATGWDTAPARQILPHRKTHTDPGEANSAKALLQQHLSVPWGKTAGRVTVFSPWIDPPWCHGTYTKKGRSGKPHCARSQPHCKVARV